MPLGFPLSPKSTAAETIIPSGKKKKRFNIPLIELLEQKSGFRQSNDSFSHMAEFTIRQATQNSFPFVPNMAAVFELKAVPAYLISHSV